MLFLSALCFAGASSLVNALVTPRDARSVSYDFVIAGAGPSGLVLANRLTEDPAVNVLVLEAGPFDQREAGILIPGYWNPGPYFWKGLNTIPLPALNNKTFPLTVARLVGGGTSLNAMNWLRGAISDYDALDTVFGNPGWSWKEVFPFFLKSENFTAPDPKFAQAANISWDDSVRAHGGPVQYSYPNYFYPGEGNWWNAARSVGFDALKDPNSGSGTGVFIAPVVLNATNLTRCDSRAAYYESVIRVRPNLHVQANTRVSRVLFNGQQAIGVEYTPSSGGAVSQVYVSKDVILTAGPVFTPQILQLSGIGPGPLLRRLKIHVVSDLPGVGTNLQDHAPLNVPYNFTNNVFPNSHSLADDATYNAIQLAAYNQHKSSAYTLIRTLSPNFATISLVDTPGYQSIISAAQAYDASKSLPAGVDRTVLAGYKAQRSHFISQMQDRNVPTGNLFWWTIGGANLASVKPFSRGTIQINSTSISDYPIINYGTGSDPTDFSVLTALFRKNRQLFAAPDMTVLGPVELAPFGPAVQTDEQILAASRQGLGITSGHACCTAPMMSKKLGGVVDNQRKVYGVTNLRVGDISAFPVEVSSGPTGTVYAMAERLADLIKQEYQLAEYRKR